MKQEAQLLVITPAWQTQPWYTTLLLMSVANPILLPKLKTLLCNLQSYIHSSVANTQLQLIAWKVSEELWQAKVYRELLRHLPQILKERAQHLITNRQDEVVMLAF